MREQNIYDALDSILVVFYVLFILSGTTYLVFWRDASGWWYLLALLFISMAGTSYTRELKHYHKENDKN